MVISQTMMMMRNIVRFAVVLVAADLYLTSGRFVDGVPKDRHEDIKDEVSVGDDLAVLDDAYLGSGVLIASDLYLTSGRFVDNVPKDRHKDVKDEVSVADDLVILKDAYLGSGAIKNIKNHLNHQVLSMEKRKAIRDRSKRWTNNEVPYEIDLSLFNNDQVQLIYDAMNEWQQNTCLRFRPRDTQDANFVKFIKDERGCYSSNYGMNGGEQKISILDSTCMNAQAIIHEIGHAIGFFHEQNRPDRDQYITILEENIQDNMKYNFDKSDQIDTYGLPYDYTSIMHYPANGFSKNGENTILTKDPSFQNFIGHYQHLSYYDIQLANLMYNCS